MSPLTGYESGTLAPLIKCDECELMARFTVSGYGFPRYLCALHAGELCESVGDTAGRDKFALLIPGDRLPL